MPRQQALFWWVVGSGALMVVGAFGPWVKLFTLSANGTDGGNDGWTVVAIAAIALTLFIWQRQTTRAGVAAIIGGALGAITTVYDRANLEDAAAGSEVGKLVEAGWGLNLAIAASISLAVSGIVWVLRFKQTTPMA